MSQSAALLHKPPSSRHGSRLVSALDKVDWSFGDRARQSELEAIHPYPAKFIPELPGTLLDILPIPPGTAIFDPFVGSGTTLVEAQRRGIPSVGVDVNPIASLISRVKTQELPAQFDNIAAQVLAQAANEQNLAAPDIPNLGHWFTRPIIEAVTRIIRAIEGSPESHQDALKIALSSILVRVSNQDSDTRYAAVEKNVSAEDVGKLFEAACSRVHRALKARSYATVSASVLERDILALTAKDIPSPVGLVITSPPYPNAYEYWLYHKYRMWWLGYDPLYVKQREIGARAHFFKTNRHTAAHFVDQMRITLNLISSVLLPEGYACFVVGRSKIHGEIIDNAAIVEAVSRESGFSTVFKTDRTIRADRKSFNLSHANIKTETLLVLGRR